MYQIMEIEFINSKYVFSLYKNLQTVDQPRANIDINQLLEAIRFGYVQEVVETLRGTISQDEYKRIKIESLPCVTLSGIFEHRDSKGLVRHSGLMQIDIDNVEAYDPLYESICRDNYTYVCFKSPGGRGIKAIVKVSPSAETHRDQFKALEVYYQNQLGIKIDSQCIDLSRCMLLSFDPNVYCNPLSDVFEEVFSHSDSTFQKPKNIAYPAYEKTPDPGAPHQVIESIIASLERGGIDITESYADWIKAGFALCETFGESGRGYFHRISRMYPDYSFKVVDSKYTELLSRNNGNTKISSLIYMAQQAGVRIPIRNVKRAKWA